MNHDEFLTWAGQIKADADSKAAEAVSRAKDIETEIAVNIDKASQAESEAKDAAAKGDYKKYKELRSQADFLRDKNEARQIELDSLRTSPLVSNEEYSDMLFKADAEYMKLHADRAARVEEIRKELEEIFEEENSELARMDEAEYYFGWVTRALKRGGTIKSVSWSNGKIYANTVKTAANYLENLDNVVIYGDTNHARKGFDVAKRNASPQRSADPAISCYGEAVNLSLYGSAN